ncbi:SRPBCC family protein [Mycolicibacterium hippocampi]|uniref:SRPBCC family protein n=1 Tax=Mycolicibacterium hippocampi TaxID=659824 RepID=UPI0035164F51
MRVERHRTLRADRHTVWSIVSDPAHYPDFMPNLERWGTVTDGPAGIGSRYTVHWKIGAAPVGGVIELVEFDPARDLAWVSITGVSIRGRFRLRDAGRDGTKVTFRLTYQSPGGVLGLLADRIASRQVGRVLSASLDNLRRLVDP